MQDYIKKILSARVYDAAVETPLDAMPRLTARLGRTVLLKREDLQPVFSFKIRGAFNKMVSLSDELKSRGVICASAGNHAQGVAMSAKLLGIKALVVMPVTTPQIKVDAVRSRGAEVLLHGDSFDDAYAYARQLESENHLAFIHPYDDPEVIAGQGTVAMEILRGYQSAVDAIFVPVGGGGLIAGVAAYVKFLKPEIKVIGVEPEDAASMYEALRQGSRVRLDQVGIFADGVGVRQIGEEPYRIARECVDEVILVSTDEICAAIKDIFDDTRSIAEPSGALAAAGLKKYAERGGRDTGALIAINSGANMNFDRLRHVAERAELGEHREALLAVKIPERAGSFRSFCESLGKRSITEFNYRYGDPDEAWVFAGVGLARGLDEKNEIVRGLEDSGYEVVDMTNNEMAKLHVRYMVGGHTPEPTGEHLFRFEFPERPGALIKFLSVMPAHWSISLFHYRNHGTDYGRVLAGIQISPEDAPRLKVFLDELGYEYCDETENPAYRIFLGLNRK